MNIRPYRELTKKEKLIVKYENKLSDFRDMLGIDLMEYIDQEFQEDTGNFFPKEEREILEDNQAGYKRASLEATASLSEFIVWGYIGCSAIDAKEKIIGQG